MRIETKTLDGGVVMVGLAGRMDVQGTEAIEQTLLDCAGTHRSVILDMSAVGMLTSAGIRTVVRMAKAVSRRGGRMALLHPDANVRKVLEIANLAQAIPTHESLEEAVRAVRFDDR
jgi:anti-anti-sigma factor